MGEFQHKLHDIYWSCFVVGVKYSHTHNNIEGKTASMYLSYQCKTKQQKLKINIGENYGFIKSEISRN